jgi:hypothetical protein
MGVGEQVLVGNVAEGGELVSVAGVRPRRDVRKGPALDARLLAVKVEAAAVVAEA